SWLMPYEEKTFTQYFMPYRELGLVKNASKDLLVNLEKDNDNLVIKLFATSKQHGLTLELFNSAGKSLLNEIVEAWPEKLYTRSIAVDKETTPENILFVLTNAAGKEVLRYEPVKNKKNEIPQPAKAALPPAEVSNNEQLFLTGQHLEQYRHATYSPVPYYEEALRRDAGDFEITMHWAPGTCGVDSLQKANPILERPLLPAPNAIQIPMIANLIITSG
ncbi:MAG: hypothetical protein ACJ751_15265, partial [Niastella sp.]